MNKPLFKSGDDWTFDLIDNIWEEIQIIGREELKIDWYPAQIEVVTAEQMLDAYSAVGMPIYYKHWSFGKEFIRNEKYYKNGQMGLAYEMVINSNPCIAYLMEENDMTMQTLVLAHASVGHSAVFKNNYLFKEHTHADAIIDYLAFTKKYLKMCEEKYGEEEVEIIIDACHALSDYGIDKYKRPRKMNIKDEEKAALEKFEQQLADYNPVWEKLVKKKAKKNESPLKYPKEPEENILYFLEKNSPLIPQWKREVIRIVRKISQYFSPQAQTKMLNEGYASFSHYYIVNRLFEKGIIDEGSMISFLRSHVGVLYQPDYDSKWFSGFNPYALGFAIFSDIKRMCENPTDEDREYFPDLVGTDWATAVNYAMKNFKDDSFIAQYLSPKVVRDFKIFHLDSEHEGSTYNVQNIHNQQGFYKVRERLSEQYNRSSFVPDIKVTGVDLSGNRKLTLTHTPVNGIPLNEKLAEETLTHLSELWEFPVELVSVDYNFHGQVPKTYYNAGKYEPELPDEDDFDNFKLESQLSSGIIIIT
jgi:stage V sporulation protein R